MGSCFARTGLRLSKTAEDRQEISSRAFLMDFRRRVSMQLAEGKAVEISDFGSRKPDGKKFLALFSSAIRYPKSEILRFRLRIGRARDRLRPRNQVNDQPNKGSSWNPGQDCDQSRIRRLAAFRVFHDPDGYPEPDSEKDYPD